MNIFTEFIKFNSALLTVDPEDCNQLSRVIDLDSLKNKTAYIEIKFNQLKSSSNNKMIKFV